MSVALQLGPWPAGRTVYALVWQDAGETALWDGLAWVSDTQPHRQAGAVYLTETATPGTYAGTLPAAVPAGTRTVTYHQRVGTQPAASGEGPYAREVVAVVPDPLTPADCWRLPGTSRTDLKEADALRAGVGDRRYLAFDFGDYPELAAGDIASAAVTGAASGLTLGPVAVVRGYMAAFWVTTTAAGEWTLICTATLTDGSTCVGVGRLKTG